MEAERLVVIGQGYVGLPLALRAAGGGYRVTGYETDQSRVKRLAAGESYVDDVGDEALGAALEAGSYQPTSEPRSCAGFDVAVITVPTPLRDGAPDLSCIEDAA